MLLDMLNLTKIRRAILYLLVLLATFFVQEIILSYVIILGVRPFIIPICVVAIGFFSNGVWGGVFGLIAGVFTDMALHTDSIMMTIIFPVMGFFAGALPMFFMSRRLFSFSAMSLAALAITAAAQMLPFLLFTDTQTKAVLFTALFQVLWSLPFIFALYFPCRSISGLRLNR